MGADTINERTLRRLRLRLGNRLVEPGDAAYEDARAVWNGMINRRPRLIGRCATADDVTACIEFANENPLVVAVRGGGHNVAGHGTCDRGLVIDLSLMRNVRVEPSARVAHVEGGATWADVDAATQAYGLATPGGVVSETGVAGLTLGGGLGHLRSLYGLACDNLRAADVITPDGRRLRAAENQNEDLLWGLRGGGGNFGVVTSFEFALHPVGPGVMFLAVFHDGELAEDALRLYRDFSAEAPDELSTIAFLGQVPPGHEAFPPDAHGLPFVAFVGVYAGPVDEGKRVVQPLRDFAEPLADFTGPAAYTQAQRFFDEEYPARRMRYYWKSTNLVRLDDEAIRRIVEHGLRQPSPNSTTDLWNISGAVKRLGNGSSAFPGRDAAFVLNPEANWTRPVDDAANVAWVRDFVAAMEPWSDGGRYLNFAGFQEEGEAMMRAAFGPHFARLVELKRKYDPSNLFRLNQNIAPA